MVAPLFFKRVMANRPGRVSSRGQRAGNPCYKVFVSHATADKWVARAICEKLDALGATTFRDDRDIKGGDDIPEEIRSEIKRSKELVVILTPVSVNRPWVLLEVGVAWGWSRNTRITAILYHVTADTIPDIIKSKKAIALNDFDTFAGEVAARIKKST